MIKKTGLVVSLLLATSLCALIEHNFVIVIPSRNNIDVCRQNLNSVFSQTYQNYRVIYCDDDSDDGTYQEIKQYIAECNMSDRVILRKNDRRRGHMYNHFTAVHLCDDDEIVVNLDGDDALAPQALEVINQAYQHDSVWMTYGQYREEPHGKHGHCKQIPKAVHALQAYRYYDWVTSHPRTFYAGLFKQVPLGYFLYEDDFQPCAVDLAMMFSMMELSQGRIIFIPQVLYHYNCANPDSIFRKNVLQQLKMGYTSRGREPLQALSFDPRIKRQSEDRSCATLIITENNPEHLQEFLASWYEHTMSNNGLHVIYAATTPDIRLRYLDLFSQYPEVAMHYVPYNKTLHEVMQRVCDTVNSKYLFIASDESVITHQYDFDFSIAWLEKTHAVGWYYQMPIDVNVQKPPLAEIESNVRAWKFKHARGQWRAVYSPTSVLYRTDDIQSVLQQTTFKTMQHLVMAWSLIPAARQEDVGLTLGN